MRLINSCLLSAALVGAVVAQAVVDNNNNWSCTKCGTKGYGEYVAGDCIMDGCDTDPNCATNCETCATCADRYMLGDVDYVSIATDECNNGKAIDWLAPATPTTLCHGSEVVNDTKLHYTDVHGEWFINPNQLGDTATFDKGDPIFKPNCGYYCYFPPGTTYAAYSGTTAPVSCRQHIALTGVCEKRTCADSACTYGYNSGKSATSICFGADRCTDECCAPPPTCSDLSGSQSCNSGYATDSTKNGDVVTNTANYNSLCCKPNTCAAFATSDGCGVGTEVDSSKDATVISSMSEYQDNCCKSSFKTCAQTSGNCSPGYTLDTTKSADDVTDTGNFNGICCRPSKCADVTTNCDDGYIVDATLSSELIGGDGSGYNSACCKPHLCKAFATDQTCTTGYAVDDTMDDTAVADSSGYSDVCCKPATCGGFAATAGCDDGFEADSGKITTGVDNVADYTILCCLPRTCAAYKIYAPDQYTCPAGSMYNVWASGSLVATPADYESVCCKAGACEGSDDNYIIEVHHECTA